VFALCYVINVLNLYRFNLNAMDFRAVLVSIKNMEIAACPQVNDAGRQGILSATKVVHF